MKDFFLKLVALLLINTSPSPASSFLPKSTVKFIPNLSSCSSDQRFLGSTFLCSSPGKNNNNNNNNNKDDDDDDDQTPRRNLWQVPLPQAPQYFSARELTHRQQELELLAQLRDDDKAIHTFRLLWYSERGPDTEVTLRQAWRNMGHPNHWQQAEDSLLQVCDQDRTYLFPFYLLSKLYCLQGRFQESQRICERILELKPYHFSVLETMVANAAGMVAQATQEKKESSHQILALQKLQVYSSQRLPPPSDKEKRLEWVEHAMDEASQVLLSAQESNHESLSHSSGINDQGILRSMKDTSKSMDDNNTTASPATARDGTWQ